MTVANQEIPETVPSAKPRVSRIENSPAQSQRHRRKVFYLLDSLHVGGTETQAVELACRLNPSQYEVTLGCLRAQGPLQERLRGSQVNVVEFYPKGGIDSLGGLHQLLRLAAL